MLAVRNVETFPFSVMNAGGRGHHSVWESRVIALSRKVKQVIDSDAQGLCSLITFTKDTKDSATQTRPREGWSSVCKGFSALLQLVPGSSEQYPVLQAQIAIYAIA